MPIDSNNKPEALIDAAEEERILSMRIGGTTVREALEAAIASGKVRRDAQGRLTLADIPEFSPWFAKGGDFAPDCQYLIRFLYPHIYQKRAVPHGCRTCYKVKVISGTMRQLMAVKAIAERLPYRSKSGPELENPQTQAVYASYFYLETLPRARQAYRQLRQEIDANAALGPSVKMIIKRGCTEYERAHGPLDDYAFDPRQDDIEAYLRTRFESGPMQKAPAAIADGMRLLNIMRVAYQIGDETYKDFNGGKDLRRPIVTYAPDEPNDPSA